MTTDFGLIERQLYGDGRAGLSRNSSPTFVPSGATLQVVSRLLRIFTGIASLFSSHPFSAILIVISVRI